MKKLKIMSCILMITFFIVSVKSVSAETYFVDGIELESSIKNDGTWFYMLEEDKTATIVGYRGNDTNLVIPEKVGENYIVDSLHTVPTILTEKTQINQGAENAEDINRAFPLFNFGDLGYVKKIETLTIPKTIERISGDIDFTDVAIYNCTLYDKNGKGIVRGFYFGAFKNLKEFIVDPENKYFSSVDGVLFNKDKTALICYPDGKEDKSYTVPNTVTNILDRAFYAPNFEEFIITENVTKMFDIFDTPPLKFSILNNHLGKTELKKESGFSRGEITVYKDSPAHKYLKSKESYGIALKLNVIDNPYIEKDESKKTTVEKAEVKDDSLNSESYVNESAADEELITIGAKDNTEVAPKPKETNEIVIITLAVAVVLLVGGITVYQLIKKKKTRS